MARFPSATWRGPVPNQGGTMGPIHGLVLHIQEGSEAGTDAWFHNPAAKVSAHFGNPKTGGLDQWVEVGTVAWHAVEANTNWIGCENEGRSGEKLTDSQVENAAELLAWLHTNYGVPLQISNSPDTPGLSGHGLGGAAWGGHYDCPGQPILDQRAAIIARASTITGSAATPGPAPQQGDEMGTIPPSISQRWPDLAGDFPPEAQFTDETALIWADAGARAAALFAQQARDAARTASQSVTLLQQVTNMLGVIVEKQNQILAATGAPVDANAIGAAVAAHLAAGGGAAPEDIAAAVTKHLAADLAAG